jgi:hypothetical protein
LDDLKSFIWVIILITLIKTEGHDGTPDWWKPINRLDAMLVASTKKVIIYDIVLVNLNGDCCSEEYPEELQFLCPLLHQLLTIQRNAAKASDQLADQKTDIAPDEPTHPHRLCAIEYFEKYMTALTNFIGQSKNDSRNH